MSTSMIWIGMDVHKDTVMVAVYLNEAREPEIVQQLPNDSRKLKRFFEQLEPAWRDPGLLRGERGRLRTAARGPALEALRDQVPGSSGLRVPAGPELDTRTPPLACEPFARWRARARGPLGVRRIPRLARLQAQPARRLGRAD